MIKLDKALVLSNLNNLLTKVKAYVDGRISALATSVSDVMEDVNSSITKLETDMESKAETGHTHSNYASAVSTTGSGNAITAISQSGNTITATKGSTFLTAHPTIEKSTDSTSTETATHGGKITAIDSVTRDSNGHVTKVNTKTITMPSAYTHPTHTAKSSGLYKVTVDSQGHVSAATAVTKADITALGIPAQDTNTTYSAATTSAAGLMSASDKSKLDGIATGATKVTVDSALSSTSTNPVQNKVINTALAEKADKDHTHSNYVETANMLQFSSVSVATAAWASDSTYADYPYRAAITCSGVTANHVPDVTFGVTEAKSANYAPTCQSAANTVYIYAKTKPSAAITIQTIEARKAV